VRPMIVRRSLILALGSMPLLIGSALSQTAVKAHRVGLLSSGAPLTDNSEVVVGLTAGFSKRGYIVGRSVVYERRAAEAHPDRLPGLVDDLKRSTELIITQSYAAARVVKDRSNVPVVAITGADPIATGLVDSLARPAATSPVSAKSRPSSRPNGWRSSKIRFRACARLPCCGTQTISG
jgi:putative ABC transport system substrate-binding protein